MAKLLFTNIACAEGPVPEILFFIAASTLSADYDSHSSQHHPLLLSSAALYDTSELQLSAPCSSTAQFSFCFKQP
jgi:hypothetical protein